MNQYLIGFISATILTTSFFLFVGDFFMFGDRHQHRCNHIDFQWPWCALFD